MGAEHLLVSWEPGRCPQALVAHLAMQHRQLLNGTATANKAVTEALETGDGSNSVIQNRSELHVTDNSPSTRQINQPNPASTPGSWPRQAWRLKDQLYS